MKEIYEGEVLIVSSEKRADRTIKIIFNLAKLEYESLQL